jgi:hypothetical protein
MSDAATVEDNITRDPADLADLCDATFGEGAGNPIHDLLDSVHTWSTVAARVCAAAEVDALVHVPAEIERLRAQIADTRTWAEDLLRDYPGMSASAIVAGISSRLS